MLQRRFASWCHIPRANQWKGDLFRSGDLSANDTRERRVRGDEGLPLQKELASQRLELCSVQVMTNLLPKPADQSASLVVVKGRESKVCAQTPMMVSQGRSAPDGRKEKRGCEAQLLANVIDDSKWNALLIGCHEVAVLSQDTKLQSKRVALRNAATHSHLRLVAP